jgi:hypothetical protein
MQSSIIVRPFVQVLAARPSALTLYVITRLSDYENSPTFQTFCQVTNKQAQFQHELAG